MEIYTVGILSPSGMAGSGMVPLSPSPFPADPPRSAATDASDATHEEKAHQGPSTGSRIYIVITLTLSIHPIGPSSPAAARPQLLRLSLCRPAASLRSSTSPLQLPTPAAAHHSAARHPARHHLAALRVRAGQLCTRGTPCPM